MMTRTQMERHIEYYRNKRNASTIWAITGFLIGAFVGWAAAWYVIARMGV